MHDILLSLNGDIRTLDEIKGDIIRLALFRYRGQVMTAARYLGIPRSTLYREIAKRDILLDELRSDGMLLRRHREGRNGRLPNGRWSTRPAPSS
jgi:hypothetical protein